MGSFHAIVNRPNAWTLNSIYSLLSKNKIVQTLGQRSFMDITPITWVFPNRSNFKSIDLNNKDEVVSFLCKNMTNYTVSMFEWKGLPPTIPQDILELFLQNVGAIGIIKVDDKLFACWGSSGGVNDYNYRPTRFIVSNPYLLNGSRNYKIYYGKDDFVNEILDSMPYDGECVVMTNDPQYMGLQPINNYYATQLAENVQTKRMVTILVRAMYLYITSDEDDKKDFDDFMKDLTDGKFGACFTNDILSKVKTLPFADRGYEALTDLIEDQQYIKASWFNNLGLQANYNMKRESINSNESQLNKDAILPLSDTMLAMRKLACERVNELFGVNWSVDFSSAWKESRKAMEEAIDGIDDSSTMDNPHADEDVQTLGQEKEKEDDS